MKPKVLFLCTGNSARRRMAEGLLRALAGNQFEVFSAGTEPKGEILPEVAEYRHHCLRGRGEELPGGLPRHGKARTLPL